MSNNHNCGCGGHSHHEHHAHNHSEGKCCGKHGHSHHKHEHHGHGCCGKHGHAPVEIPAITAEQRQILLSMAKTTYLPLVRFVMKSSKSSHFESVALAPVYLQDENASMDEVKACGKILTDMEALGLITLDYDIPLDSYEYSEYKNSAVYSYFIKTMEESIGKDGFVFDTADFEKGSIAMTDVGHKILHDIIHS